MAVLLVYSFPNLIIHSTRLSNDTNKLGQRRKTAIHSDKTVGPIKYTVNGWCLCASYVLVLKFRCRPAHNYTVLNQQEFKVFFFFVIS